MDVQHAPETAGFVPRERLDRLFVGSVDNYDAIVVVAQGGRLSGGAWHRRGGYDDLGRGQCRETVCTRLVRRNHLCWVELAEHKRGRV